MFYFLLSLAILSECIIKNILQIFYKIILNVTNNLHLCLSLCLFYMAINAIDSAA